MGGEPYHLPVLCAEVVDALSNVPPGLVIDATVGGGGHAEAILRNRGDLRIVGLDLDPRAVEYAAERLERVAPGRARVRQGRADEMERVLEELGETGPVTGVLFDLGVSSAQLRDPRRGFSYHAEGPLDMRMDPTQELTAADVVNEYDVERLEDVIRRWGDERHARRIAATIAKARPIKSTTELARVVASAVPASDRRRGHPARRTFQAIRIEVNGELVHLGEAVDTAIDLLAVEGRCLAITYHSGEDRIVVDRFKRAVKGGCLCPAASPCVCGATPKAKWVSRKPTRPSQAEVESNPRARSARLRMVERVGSTNAGSGERKLVRG
ncbi:MAG: ribosomal RNA small subunit methyltransferase H [Acidimicrobiales bacterium]|nr:MAG: ribosomal RNA small subunit methyltransferase H [Acidimicrobiales bacterium]